MRTLVFGDIHGGLRALKEVLEKTNPAPENLLVFLGDYVDGWSDAAETLDFLMELKKERRCLFLQGKPR